MLTANISFIIPVACAGLYKAPAGSAREGVHGASDPRGPVRAGQQYAGAASGAEGEGIKRAAGDATAPEGFPQQVPGGNMAYAHPFHTMPYGGFYGYQYMPVSAYLCLGAA